MRRNGFLTFYVMWIGAVVLAVSISISTLAACHLQLAAQYEESLQLTYEAESALQLSWHELKTSPWQEVPSKKKWRFSDEHQIIAAGHYAEIQCIASPYELPFGGTLRAAAVAEKSLLQRTCAYVFEVGPIEGENEVSYTVQNIIY